MGLFRKRWLQKVADAVAVSSGNLKTIVGTEIPIQVDDASFPESEEVMDDFFMHEIYGLGSITKALETVSRDALGKEAVQEQVKSVLLRNTATGFEDEGSKSVSLKKGELLVCCAFSNGSNNLYRPDELAKAIEKLL